MFSVWRFQKVNKSKIGIRKAQKTHTQIFVFLALGISLQLAETKLKKVA